MTEKAEIFYKDIGDYLSREEKLRIVRDSGSILALLPDIVRLTPNEHGDWITQRNDAFANLIAIGDKDERFAATFFTSHYSNGLKTARDHFCWNYSEKSLMENINTIINFYNQQCKDYHIAKEKNEKLKLEDFVSYDSTKITWNRGFKQDIERGTKFKFNKENIFQGCYRPFCKQYLYFSKELNDMTYQMPKIFPTPEIENKVICVPGIGSMKPFDVLITDSIPDLGLESACQCFPLYWYEEVASQQSHLFENTEKKYIRRDGISDFIVDQAKSRYGFKVTKEDIFYYVYGILHSPDYRKTFVNDLKKMLPRLPLVETSADFWDFSESGRKLADLHLNYEDQPPPDGVKINAVTTNLFPNPYSPYPSLTVTKMTFPAKGKTDAIKYNADITISNIPEKAYQYIVNGKSAIEWIMERYAVTTHKESGIQNDPNDWSVEHGNPRYILDLLLSVITVSIKTVDIISSLPRLKFNNG